MKDEQANNSQTPRSRFNFTNNRLTPTTTPSPVEKLQHEPADSRSVSQPHLGGRKHQHTEKTGPLIFNVATLLRDPEGSHRDYDFEQDRLPMAQEPGEKPEEATNITGHVRLTRIRHDVLTQGKGEADVVLECVRCLNDFEYHVNFELEEVFRPSIDITSGLLVKAETLDEESDLKLDANHLLNLGEAIRQQILVSLPLKPICGEDCPGLSEVLARVNQSTTVEIEEEAEEEEAEEIAPPVDKRWAALAQLLQKDDESE